MFEIGINLWLLWMYKWLLSVSVDLSQNAFSTSIEWYFIRPSVKLSKTRYGRTLLIIWTNIVMYHIRVHSILDFFWQFTT